MRDELEIEVINATTGRPATIREGDRLLTWVDNLVERLIDGLVDIDDPKFWHSPWVAKLFAEAQAHTKRHPLSRYFRGRRVDLSIQPAPTRDQFGPAPAGRSNPGRYSRAGEQAIYLATSPDVVRAELDGSGTLFVQEFDLRPLSAQMVVLDESIDSSAGFNYLVMKTERAERQAGNAQYRASLLVRELCARCNADGLAYPSVRLTAPLDAPANVVSWGDAAQQVAACAVGDPIRG